MPGSEKVVGGDEAVVLAWAASEARRRRKREREKKKKEIRIRWKDFAAAYKTYNDLQSTMAKAITEFVRTHSFDDPTERQEAACNGDQQKQEHNVEEDPHKAKKKKTKGADHNAAAAAGNSTHASSIEAKVEDPSSVFESLLADLEGQSEKNVEDNGSLCKLLEIETVQAQNATNGRSSNKLAGHCLGISPSNFFRQCGGVAPPKFVVHQVMPKTGILQH
ncbi:hypothetical protein ACLB2K_033455 [Fragaria x ananassa]